VNKLDIIEMKARNGRYLDTECWDGFAARFSQMPELTFYSPDGGITATFTSVADFVTLTSDLLAGAQSIHQIHNAEIDVSGSEVSAIWSMEDHILFPTGDKKRPCSMHGYGQYHEIWTRNSDDWVTARMDLRRTSLELQQWDHHV
jgi:hypothetical protein